MKGFFPTPDTEAKNCPTVDLHSNFQAKEYKLDTPIFKSTPDIAKYLTLTFDTLTLLHGVFYTFLVTFCKVSNSAKNLRQDHCQYVKQELFVGWLVKCFLDGDSRLAGPQKEAY